MSMFNVADKKEVLNKYFQKKQAEDLARKKPFYVFSLSFVVGLFTSLAVVACFYIYNSDISTSYKMVNIFLILILISNILSKFFVYALK